MKVFLSFVFLFLSLFILAQKEYANWRFGWMAGVNFLTYPPTVTSGSTFCSAATTTQSDSLGNLLFYTQVGGNVGFDIVIYNKYDDTLANGANIFGCYHSQPVIIIPKSHTQYYVITHEGDNYNLPQPFPPMTFYSIVDMSMAAGSGSVILKNAALSSPGLAMVSKMAASPHCNATDYWLLRHGGGQPGNNLYYSYLVSATSINTVPVITSIGAIQPQGMVPAYPAYFGQHKFSPNGRKVAATMPYSTVELYDFNPATGQLSNMMRLDSVMAPNSPTVSLFSEQCARGLEFSPDGSKLYVSYINKHPHICQFDLSLATPAQVKASKTIIVHDTITSQGLSRPPQLAYDGKIYFANSNFQEYLNVINYPNLAGAACGYSPLAMYIGTTALITQTASVGDQLISAIASSFEKKPLIPPITGSIICGVVNFSAPVLSAIAGYSVSSYAWNFNDPLSGSNTSTLSQPTHTFSANGSYTVKLALNYYPCGTDTLKQVININGLPQLGHGGRNPICKNESTVLNFTGAGTYSLNMQSLPQNTVQIQPTVTTVYTLTGTDNSGCSAKKTFTVSVLPCTAVSEQLANEELKVYPNPNSGRFTLETKTRGELQLYNSQGQSVFRKQITEGQGEMDLGEIPKGIYILTWQSESVWLNLKLVID